MSKRLSIRDIEEIRQKRNGKGYEIVFQDGRIIWLTKRRTIAALLMLIEYGVSSEADLARGSEHLAEIKRMLTGRYEEEWIRDGYADANKPFSELWNEEGFTWIHPAQEKLQGNQQYVLRPEDHDRLFEDVKKAFRLSLSSENQKKIIAKQRDLCNLCGSKLRARKQIEKTTFAKDRVRMVFDHRTPVERGGKSTLVNYQALCFYCNKSKWQICNICDLPDCDADCSLAYPERSTVISPTQENISDRMKRQD